MFPLRLICILNHNYQVNSNEDTPRCAYVPNIYDETFCKMGSFYPLTIFVKSSVVDVREGPKDVSQPRITNRRCYIEKEHLF